MKNLNIYLGGKMSGITLEEARFLRDVVSTKLLLLSSDTDVKLSICNPCNYYNFSENAPSYDSEEEVRNYDLWRVRHSDLFIVFFIGDGKSQGTTAELTLAKELHIPIVGLDTVGIGNIHPWDLCCVDKMFADYTDLCNYIKDFYMN